MPKLPQQKLGKSSMINKERVLVHKVLWPDMFSETNTFGKRARAAVLEVGNPCVLGLDPSLELIPNWFAEEFSQQGPVRVISEYCLYLIRLVSDLVPFVKPQSAWFEIYGSDGIRALEEVLEECRRRNKIVILDAKRGDIGSTSKAYASAYLSDKSPLAVDALTVNPYLGPDSLEPLVAAALGSGRGLFVCASTSNPGGPYLQNLEANGRQLFLHVAEMVSKFESDLTHEDWPSIGVVAGATHPSNAIALRRALPRSLFLVPGVGAQGGNLDKVSLFLDEMGGGALLSASRALMYPNAQRDKHSMAVRQGVLDFVSTSQTGIRKAQP